MIEQVRIDNSLQEFQSQLMAMPDLEVVRRYVVDGPSLLLEGGSYFDLRSAIADRFDVHPNEVVMVGSAKLGFSLSPRKRYRYFCDESDIDIAIVSSPMFDRVWRSVYDFSQDGGYWTDRAKFSEYLFQGWIRPDKLPSASRFDYCRDWWEFFRGLTASGQYGPYSIRAGLYRSWFFLENYHMMSVRQCRSIAGDPS